MSVRTCEYCRQPLTDTQTTCPHCGSLVSNPSVGAVERHEPFFLNGYVVWPLRDLQTDTITFQFWQGMELICGIPFERDLMHELSKDGMTSDDLLWQTFLLATGKTDQVDLRLRTERGTWAHIVLTRSEDDDPWWQGLKARELAMALAGRAQHG